MKFLCDRCKTRYSIGDERVRGKILKIRCKNCANVITVREGMAADPEAAAPEAAAPEATAPEATAPEAAARPKKVTTVAPVALEERSVAASGGGPVTQKLGRSSDGGPVTQKLGRPGDDAPVTQKLGRSGGDAPVMQKLGRPGDRREPAAASRAGAARDPAAGNRGGAPAVAASPAAAAASRGAGARDPATIRDADAAARARRDAQADAVRDQGGVGRGEAEASRGDPVNALNAAFASAMAQPPPAALEEEWYVSIDGEQAGPFSLADAQRWVAQQPLDAELHCWSEGFDDWLPVDKVSHFRGLRKQPTAPPPLPRAGVPPRAAAAAPAPALAPADDEPKPLFAATMASLERGAPAVPTTRPGLSPPVAPARATPRLGSAIPPRGGLGQNGVHGAAIAPLQARPEVKPPEVKIDAKPEAKIDAKPEAKIEAKLDAKLENRPIASSPAALPRFPIANPFDVSEGGDAATQLEAMPFEDAPAPGREPRPSASDAGVTAPPPPASITLHGSGASAAVTKPAASDFGSDGGDLDIGEVSRVVNLADVSRTSRTNSRPGTPRPGSVSSRATGMNPSVRLGTRPGAGSTGAVGSLAAAGAPGADSDPAMSMAPVVRAHRRGLIVLLAVAGVVVLGVIGAVVVFVTREDDTTTGGSLGEVHGIDTSRPEDPVTHRPVGSAAAPAPPAPSPPRPVPRPRPNPAITAGNQAAEVPAGGLASDEIEDVARKHQDMTQRCYMRSQRGADAILIGDVKKIAVTLTIDREGNVSDLQLSEHAADNLGKCLSTAIKGWKFRQSTGGIYRFSLAFASG